MAFMIRAPVRSSFESPNGLEDPSMLRMRGIAFDVLNTLSFPLRRGLYAYDTTAFDVLVPCTVVLGVQLSLVLPSSFSREA